MLREASKRQNEISHLIPLPMTTFYVTDERMLLHKCEWDDTHIEIPERLKSVSEAIERSGLLSQCTQLESREATKNELKLVHTDDYISAIESTQHMSPEELEKFSSGYEDIYVNNYTWQCALLSAGCALLATEKVLDTSGSNAFAAIRPPGHHAWSDQACGFCIFNNVALCAKAARLRGVERVLIVDFDVHAAQGTQYCIEGDPGIRLISIHRYENGSFWPSLPESASRSEYTNTYNIPLHETGYGNAEYAAFMNHFVLPIIHDYKPELLLISCGFDAALYDPEGEMRVTPKGFAYMAGSLASLGIPLCALLEGGYFVEAMGDLATATLEALIERKPPKLQLHLPSLTFVETLLSATALYRSEFPLLQRWISIVNSIRTASGKAVIEEPSDEYKATREFSLPYPTRGVYDKRPEEVDKGLGQEFQEVVIEESSYMPNNSVDFGFEDGHLVMLNDVHKTGCALPSDDDFFLLFYHMLVPLSASRSVTLNGLPLHARSARLYWDNVDVKHNSAGRRRSQESNTDNALREFILELMGTFQELRLLE